jgi:PIN domain nuclease of toxin-antitoxin system
MLVAQASLESLTLLTADARLRAYGVQVFIA